MSTTQQMNQARKAVRSAIGSSGKDTSLLHRVAMDTLLAAGMKACIVQEMGRKAMLDVVCGI